MYTRQHYKQFLDAVVAAKVCPKCAGRLVAEMTDIFAADNPHFDRVRFANYYAQQILKMMDSPHIKEATNDCTT